MFYFIAFVVGNFALLSRAICFAAIWVGILVFYKILLTPIMYLLSTNWETVGIIHIPLVLLNFKAINNLSKHVELLVERLFLIKDDAPDIIDVMLVPLRYFVPYFQNNNTLYESSVIPFPYTNNKLMLPDNSSPSVTFGMPIIYQKAVCTLSNGMHNLIYYSLYVGPPIATGVSIIAIRKVFEMPFKIATMMEGIENEMVNGNDPERGQIGWLPSFMGSYTDTSLFRIFRKDTHAVSVFAAVSTYYETIAFYNSDLISTIADDSQQLLLGLMFVTPDTCNNINKDLV